jgi:hypothetical protein
MILRLLSRKRPKAWRKNSKLKKRLRAEFARERDQNPEAGERRLVLLAVEEGLSLGKQVFLFSKALARTVGERVK